MVRLSGALIACLLAASVAWPGHAVETAAPDADPGMGRYIVVLRSDVDPDDVVRAHGLAAERHFRSALKGFAGNLPKAKLAALRADPRVRSIEEDQMVTLAQPLAPPVVEGPEQAALASAQVVPTGVDRTDADLNPTAHIDGVDERVSVDIAIIDTGIQLNHPDLNVVGGVNCTTGSGYNDLNGHGTHVAGTAAAKDNSIGVVGMAPGARLWAVRVLNSSGSGYISWIICGIDWVTQHAATIGVANMSLGCACTSQALNQAISRSVAAGVVYAVAAGNDGRDASGYSPANHPAVITVSAMADSDGRCGGRGPSTGAGPDDSLASFSNYGRDVNIAAPGVAIRSTYRGSTYATLSGTSMATPHVTGAVALLLARVGRDANHDGRMDGADVTAIRAMLQSAAVAQGQPCDPTKNNGFGGFSRDRDGYPEPLLYAAGL